MVAENLNDKLKRLNTLQGYMRKELKDHFLQYSRECGLCKECELRYHIVEIYELRCVNPKHKHNLRKGDIYTRAEEFVVFNFIHDGK